MAYKGHYKIKHPEKYEGDPNTVVYRSLWERYTFKWCDHNPDIKSWSSEEVVIPYLYEVDKKYHRYFVDLKITFNDGKTILVEIKPHAQTAPPKKPSRRTKRYINEGYTYIKNRNKWDAAAEFCENRGWHFEIWTEKYLTEKGILPKSTRKMAPYRRRK